MRKIVYLFLVLFIVSYASPVICYQTEEPACGNWNVLMAYDEEMAEHSFSFYAPFPGGTFPVEPKKYMEFQFWRGTYKFAEEFDIHFHIVKWVQFESNDSLTTTDEVYLDAVRKLNWQPNSLGRVHLDNGKDATVLMVWSEQPAADFYDVWGFPHAYCGSAFVENDVRGVIIHPYDIWADDNVVQHELSHLFGCAKDDHRIEKDCVMGYYKDPAPSLYWENLYPIFDQDQLISLATYGSIREGFLTKEWCDECRAFIETKQFWDAAASTEPFTDLERPVSIYPPWQRFLIIIGIIAVVTVPLVLTIYAMMMRNLCQGG